jgi:hypothetical protein
LFNHWCREGPGASTLCPTIGGIIYWWYSSRIQRIWTLLLASMALNIVQYQLVHWAKETRRPKGWGCQILLEGGHCSHPFLVGSTLQASLE